MRLADIELGKALRSKWFVLAMGISLAISVAAGLHMGFDYLNNAQALADFATSKGVYSSPSCRSSFRFWMSVEYDYPLSPLFYQLAPLLAVIPFAWSMRTEMMSGYVNQIYTRVSRARYVAAKGVATFVTGGLVGMVPQVVNFAVVSAVVPAITPDIRDEMYLGVSAEHMWSYWFYNEPFVYVTLYCLLGFVLCGMWALFVMSLSFVIENRIVLLTFPYLALVVLQFVNDNIFTAVFGGVHAVQFSVLGNLRSATGSYGQSEWVILGLLVVLLLVSLLVMRLRMRKDVL